MSLDAKPSIPSGATLSDVLQQDEDKSTQIVVNSVAEFIENVVKVNKADGTETFYRGHADKDWVLLPSIFRTPNGIANEHLLFRDMVAHEPQSFSECESALDYLVQMQHYGLPTRLLDVTTNPLVALYFTCQTTDNALAGALAGAQEGFQVTEKALITGQSIIQELLQIKPDTDIHIIAHTIVQAIIKTIPVADSAAVEEVIAEVLGSTTSKGDTQDTFSDILRVLVGAIIQAADMAGTQEATSMIILVAVLMAAVGSSKKTHLDNKLFFRVSAVAGALVGAGVRAVDGRSAADIAMATEGIGAITAEPAECPVEFATLFCAQAGERVGKEVGARARDKDGVVYLFSAPENKVKHYDSDTVSILANLAKCQISERCSKLLSLKDFNKQQDIKFLLHQIRGEKPHFQPLIQASDLSSMFFVKAKNGNQRITNQMGAFLLFGLGIEQDKNTDEAGESLRLTKSIYAEIPSEWIKVKFIVPKDKKKKILEELANLGITESYIYPGIEQYAKELKKRYNL